MFFYKIYPKLIFNILFKKKYLIKYNLFYFNFRKFIFPLYSFRILFYYSIGNHYIYKYSNKFCSGYPVGFFGLSVKNLIYIKKIKKKKKKK